MKQSGQRKLVKKNLVLIFVVLVVAAFGFQSVSAQDDEPIDRRVRLFIAEIREAKKEVDEFTPQNDAYLVNGEYQKWVWNAISPKLRKQFMESWKPVPSPESLKRLDEALDELKASAAQKLPTYLPDNNYFAFHNLAEENLMKGMLENPPDIKIFKIGIYYSTWQIAKDDYNLPTGRYKQGYMWVRNTIDSHPYCRLFQINLIQDYAGGGTYGQTYARFIDDTLIGCPAGK